MEPRLLRRGNAVPASRYNAPSGFNGATPSQTWKRKLIQAGLQNYIRLQWSHAFSDVETDTTATDEVTLIMLQWSHAFSDVET